jgi:hypothetical protein
MKQRFYIYVRYWFQVIIHIRRDEGRGGTRGEGSDEGKGMGRGGWQRGKGGGGGEQGREGMTLCIHT